MHTFLTWPRSTGCLHLNFSKLLQWLSGNFSQTLAEALLELVNLWLPAFPTVSRDTPSSESSSKSLNHPEATFPYLKNTILLHRVLV